MAHTRRGTLAFGAGLIAVAAGWQVFGVRDRAALVFEPIEGAPGWEFALAGAVSGLSGANDFLTIGLSSRDAPPGLPAGELGAAVHRAGLTAGKAPLAVFSDFFCPYCRTLTARIAGALAEPGFDVGVTWHELPLLSPQSEKASRALLAADVQGAYLRYHEVLQARGFRPSDRYLSALAAEISLDPDAFLAAMSSPATSERLQTSARAARSLNVSATPGLVIGRRVILGAIDLPQILDLVSQTDW